MLQCDVEAVSNMTVVLQSVPIRLLVSKLTGNVITAIYAAHFPEGPG